jgi:transcriptional regulator with XRE-family HTH domain
VVKKKYLNREKDLIAFGVHLKELREKRNFSMKELADMCGIEHSQISKIERGLQNPGLSQILTIAEALEIHPKELFDF